MSKSLQVLPQDKELAEIQQSARRQQMTTGEWVRQALRAARRGEPRIGTRKKLEVVRAAARHAFPVDSCAFVVAELEQDHRVTRACSRPKPERYQY